jgi:hypothetical protein
MARGSTMTRGFFPLLIAMCGLLLLATAAIEYALARDRQREAQGILDARWAVQHQGTHPKALPPARGPREIAPMEGLAKVLGLSVGGLGLIAAAAFIWIWQRRRRRNLQSATRYA